MKFKLIIKDEKNKPWEEEYEKNIPDAREWGEYIIKKFNDTLYPGEKPRELVNVIVIDESNFGIHDWHKRVDGMSREIKVRQRDKHTIIADTYYCSKCGITGKRIGLDQPIVRDWKYRAKKYEKCSK